jgi:hypothetical protein
MTTKTPSGRMRKAQEKKATATRTGLRAGDIIFAIIAVVGGLHVLIMLGIEINRYHYTSLEVSRLQSELTVLEREMADLSTIIEHGHDQRYREHLARQQGFIFPDEARYVTLHP